MQYPSHDRADLGLSTCVLSSKTAKPHRSDCDLFHPTVCKQSLHKGECKTNNCKKLHIKGTKQQAAEKPDKRNATGQKKKEQQKTPTTDNENGERSFLDVIKSLEDKLTAMDQRVQAISLQQQQQPASIHQMTQNQPQMLNPMMMQMLNMIMSQQGGRAPAVPQQQQQQQAQQGALLA